MTGTNFKKDFKFYLERSAYTFCHVKQFRVQQVFLLAFPCLERVRNFINSFNMSVLINSYNYVHKSP